MFHFSTCFRFPQFLNFSRIARGRQEREETICLRLNSCFALGWLRTNLVFVSARISMMDAQTVSKQFYGTIDRSYNEVHRLALVRHYFTIKAEEEKKGTWTSLAIKKRDPTILLKTILRFREDFPDLMWYPGDASLKKFIDAVKANKPYYDRRKDSIGTVRRVRTEENWKRIETLLDSDKNISMSEITRITGISYETGTDSLTYIMF